MWDIPLTNLFADPAYKLGAAPPSAIQEPSAILSNSLPYFSPFKDEFWTGWTNMMDSEVLSQLESWFLHTISMFIAMF